MTQWMKVWKANDWCKTNGSPLANESDFKSLNRAIIENSFMKIRMTHIPGHSGDVFNNLADRLAKQGARVDRQQRYG